MLSGSFHETLFVLAIRAPAFLLAFSAHEFAHACTAHVLGDDTAKRIGRLTMNPLAHVDPIGFLCLLMFGIGWAVPVPFDARNFKYPRIYSVLTAFAGPLTNIGLALLSFYAMKLVAVLALAKPVTAMLLQVLSATAWINIMLGVFNALPIPPLDGSHLLVALIGNRFPGVVAWLYNYSWIILLASILLPGSPLPIWLSHAVLYVDQVLRSWVF